MAKKPEDPVSKIKDAILFLGGASGIGYQLLTDHVNVLLLIVFTAMTGVPGLTNIISLFRNLPTDVLQSSQAPSRSVSEQEQRSQNVSGDPV